MARWAPSPRPAENSRRRTVMMSSTAERRLLLPTFFAKPMRTGFCISLSVSLFSLSRSSARLKKMTVTFVKPAELREHLTVPPGLFGVQPPTSNLQRPVSGACLRGCKAWRYESNVLVEVLRTWLPSERWLQHTMAGYSTAGLFCWERRWYPVSGSIVL